MSSPVKALWDRLTPEQRKEMADIAAGWLAGRQTMDNDVPMEDDAGDDPAPPSSAAPPSSSAVPFSPVHCTMSISEARAHYMDMVREEREEKFREAQADAAYNHHLLQEHLQAEEQLAADMAVASDADVADQEALLESYRSARQIHLDRWWYRQWVAEVAVAASKEGDDTGEALFGVTDDEEEDITESAGDVGSEEE